jgi:hypothetical protein
LLPNHEEQIWTEHETLRTLLKILTSDNYLYWITSLISLYQSLHNVLCKPDVTILELHI